MRYKLHAKYSLATLSSILILNGCSSGNNSSVVEPTNVNGPVSLTEIQRMFNPTSAVSNKLSLKSGDGSGCGQVMGDAQHALAFADGFINYIPDVGHALDFVGSQAANVLGYASGQEGSACTQNKFANMQSQLNYQENQIQQLATAIKTQNTEIWTNLALDENQAFQNTYTTYQNALNDISGTNGTVNSIMNEAGLWNSNTGGLGQNALESASTAVNNILNNQYANYGNFANSIGDLNPADITNIAGVAIDSNGVVTQDKTTAFLSTLGTLNLALKDSLASIMGNSPDENIVPFIQDYNNFINQLYVSNALALQQAYFVNYFVNYMNYANYLTSLNNANHQPTQSQYLANKNLEVPGVYFVPANQPDSNCSLQDTSESAVTACYNKAQQNLSELYANIFNQLYLNALNYTISDAPFTGQNYVNMSHEVFSIQNGTWESTGETINYGTQVSSNVGTSIELVYSLYQANGLGSLVTSLQNINCDNVDTAVNPSCLPSNSGGGTMKVLGIYQQNLPNPIACANGLKQYNLSGGGSFTSFIGSPAYHSSGCGDFVLSSSYYNNSFASLNTLKPLISFNYPFGAVSVTNNIKACNPEPAGGVPAFNMYIYDLGLMCGNWKTTGFPSTGQVTYSTANSENLVGQIVNQNWGNEGIFKIGSNVSGITLMNANSDLFSISNNTITAKGLSSTSPSGSYGGFSNIAAIQITVIDGLIIPLGIAYTNRNGSGGN
ncbi:MAG: hypothetical protein PHC75_01575, partial [Burkholderiales bacterium]|nr:hypothetical protein [Burkholderiales bacterium]